MTVSYSRLVANGSSFGCFWKILFKWRGSVYKLVWRELIVYLFLYYSLNLTYRFFLSQDQRVIFEEIRQYFSTYSSAIPLTFVLGFYVSLVVKRWWEQYRLLPWPDTLALFVSAAIPGADERGRLMRRNIVRYAVLAYVITLKHVSVRVKKRFPTLQHIVDAGLMMESEKKIMEMMDEKSPMAKYWMPLVWATNIINRARKETFISSDHVVQTLLVELSEHRRRLGSIISYDTVCIPLVYTQPQFPVLPKIGLMMESEKKIFELMDERHPMAKYWLPLTWAVNIMNRARKERLILSDHMVQTMLLEMSDIRQRLGSLIGYDNVTVPLVYTQVVTLAVYMYFLSALLGQQFVEACSATVSTNCKQLVDLYFPVFTSMQFCFYVGWLKVAEVLIGPFGEDDDDIELNWLIDRHIKAAYMIVDEMHEEHPELLKDQYWDEVVPKDLPYTLASEQYRRHEPKGSAEFYKVKESESLYANLAHHRKSMPHDDVYADYESVDTPMVERRKNWFQRQMQRMGSVRSSSTMYSSGLFGNRTRHNSVYATPDAVIVGGERPPTNGYGPGAHHNPHNPHHHPNKMSIYDRLIGRKSTRRGSRPSNKLNIVGVPANLKNRPRIPTPDVTRELALTDKDNKLIFPSNNNNINNNLINTISGTVSNSNGPATPAILPAEYSPTLLQVTLSPIQEMDANQTTITSTGSTAALAQAILSPTLTSAGISGVIQPIAVAVNPVPMVSVTMSQPLFDSLGLTTLTTTQAPTMASMPVKITELPADDRNDSACGSSSGSTSSNEDRSRKTSVTSQRRGEVYV